VIRSYLCRLKSACEKKDIYLLTERRPKRRYCLWKWASSDNRTWKLHTTHLPQGNA